MYIEHACRLPVVNFAKTPAPAVALTAFSSASYRSTSVTNIDQKFTLHEPIKSSQSSDTLGSDGFVKPHPKGLMNYFKNSGLLGSKKDQGKNLMSPQDKQSKSPSALKWLTSFSPKKSLPSTSASSESLTDSKFNIRTASGSDPCLSPLNLPDLDSKRWKVATSSEEELATESLSNGKCDAINTSCLRARKAISCDVLGEIKIKIEDTVSTDPGVSKFNGQTSDSGANAINATLSNSNRKLKASDKTSPKFKSYEMESLMIRSEKTGAQKRRNSIANHGIPAKETNLLTPKKPPRSSLTSSSVKPPLPSTRNSTSRLSFPVPTQRSRVSTSPRTRPLITSTPKKPPRLSLTGVQLVIQCINYCVEMKCYVLYAGNIFSECVL